jgi:hypothetical protein
MSESIGLATPRLGREVEHFGRAIIGTHDGTPYMVPELLEGETLGSACRAEFYLGAKAIEIAIQIAPLN